MKIHEALRKADMGSISARKVKGSFTIRIEQYETKVVGITTFRERRVNLGANAIDGIYLDFEKTGDDDKDGRGTVRIFTIEDGGKYVYLVLRKSDVVMSQDQELAYLIIDIMESHFNGVKLTAIAQ